MRLTFHVLYGSGWIGVAVLRRQSHVYTIIGNKSEYLNHLTLTGQFVRT